MMKRIIFLGLLGLVVGYLIFGRVGGEFIAITDLLNFSENILDDITQSITGVKQARQNILVSGAVGAGVGLILTLGRRD